MSGDGKRSLCATAPVLDSTGDWIWYETCDNSQKSKGFDKPVFQRYNLNDLQICSGFCAKACSKAMQKKPNKQEMIPNYSINQK
jgi:hypothetical protein